MNLETGAETAVAKRILIIAGPNGAGKTTFAREFLPNEATCLTFLNADMIAQGLSPFAPERAAIKAGRLVLEMMHDLSGRGESFSFETTLAVRTYARKIASWQADGYHVKLFFLSLPSPEVAIERVAARVRLGGHLVPDEVVRRRFISGKRNFERIYRDLVETWALYDNSGDRPILVDWGAKS